MSSLQRCTGCGGYALQLVEGRCLFCQYSHLTTCSNEDAARRLGFTREDHSKFEGEKAPKT